MKVRKLKKLRQEMAGWPETSKCPSYFGYSKYEYLESKRVFGAMYVTSWRAHQWRKYE